MNEPLGPAANDGYREQPLLRELAWSAALIGGVVAYLVLIVQFVP